MNRIFKYSSLSAIALIALSGCSDELLYLSPDSPNNADSKVPFGTIVFRTGGESRASILTNDNLSALEATAYIDLEKNEFKFEKYLFNKRDEESNNLVCDKNPQWPGTHRYKKPEIDEHGNPVLDENGDFKYPEGTPDAQKIPEKYKDWKLNPFNEDADANYAGYHEPQPGKVVNIEDVPTGYVYLEDYRDPDWIYIVDYDEPSTLNLFVYSPSLQQLREAFNSGTPGKPGSAGIMLKGPEGVYDFFNTYVDGVGVKPPENFNEHTELKIYYQDGVAKPGYKLGMFHVAQDISRQVDFVTAHIDPKARKINENDEDGQKYYTLESVPVHFEHQLCNIEIKARNANPDYDVDVAGVMIGRPMVYGPMFNFTTNEWEFPPLTRQDLYDMVTYPYFPADDKHPVGDYIHRLGPDAVSLMGNGGNALVLPTKLDAWDYQDPDNPDAYNFNHGDRPIMFLAALIQVLPKNDNSSAKSSSTSSIMYPFGYPDDGDWYYDPEIAGEGGWIYDGPNWGYFDDGWYPFIEDEFYYDGDGWETTPPDGNAIRRRDYGHTMRIWKKTPDIQTIYGC